ncbi:MAG: hypothetical protein PHQ53_02510 [Candidatus Krumholzibacteria bacterium]|nr:hypothetical protein [Candidatus Krumholzibacteria bacterium]
MRGTVLILAAFLLVVSVCGGCAKLPAQTPEEGALTFAAADLQDAIPLSFGDLIAVTTNETFPGWAQLWFQKEDKSVVAVYVQYSQRRLALRALSIPRS